MSFIHSKYNFLKSAVIWKDNSKLYSKCVVGKKDLYINLKNIQLFHKKNLLG